jgi:chromosome partitioning protein
MKVVVFASQKGGSGKTTLAGHVAVQAQRNGDGPVAIMDTDPQGSMSEWLNVREDATPRFVSTTPDQIQDNLHKLRDEGVRLVVIDTPPAITSTIGAVIKVADLVVIPSRPSPHDLRAAGATVELCENLKKSIIFAINGATPRARITTEAVIALSQHGAVSPAILHQRVDFASSMIDGRTVMELPGASRSPGEVELLWTYVKDTLNKSQRPRIVGSPMAVSGPQVDGDSDRYEVKGAA